MFMFCHGETIHSQYMAGITRKQDTTDICFLHNIEFRAKDNWNNWHHFLLVGKILHWEIMRIEDGMSCQDFLNQYIRGHFSFYSWLVSPWLSLTFLTSGYLNDLGASILNFAFSPCRIVQCFHNRLLLTSRIPLMLQSSGIRVPSCLAFIWTN